MQESIPTDIAVGNGGIRTLRVLEAVLNRLSDRLEIQSK